MGRDGTGWDGMGWDRMGKNEEKMLEKAMEVAYSAW